jgi:hypothetical protein
LKHVHVGVGGQRNGITSLTQLRAFVGLNCNNLIVMHAIEKVKFVNAQQAEPICYFKNIKLSLMMG